MSACSPTSTIGASALPCARILDDIKSPTPADIDIAQSIDPLPITEIASGLGLKLDEFEQHGRCKAKVHLDVLKR